MVVARYAGWVVHLLIVVALAIVPQARLVKVVKTYATSDGIDELCIFHRLRDDIGQRQSEEVDLA